MSSVYGLDFGLEDLDLTFIPDNDIEWESDEEEEEDPFLTNTSVEAASSKPKQALEDDTIGFGDTESGKEDNDRKSTGKFGGEKSSNNTGKFKFVEFGTHPQPFQQLLKNLTDLKRSYQSNRLKGKSPRSRSPAASRRGSPDVTNRTLRGGSKSPTRRTAPPPPSKMTNMFDIKAYQKTMYQQSGKKKKDVSQFHPAGPKWNGTKTPDQNMLKGLYRSPCPDASGKLIKSLQRDEAKGVARWKPVEVDRSLPVPTPNMCSETFQRVLSRHLDQAIEKIKEEYDHLPQNTLAKSNLKASVGADLHNLIRQREEVQRALSSANMESNDDAGRIFSRKAGTH